MMFFINIVHLRLVKSKKKSRGISMIYSNAETEVKLVIFNMLSSIIFVRLLPIPSPK